MLVLVTVNVLDRHDLNLSDESAKTTALFWQFPQIRSSTTYPSLDDAARQVLEEDPLLLQDVLRHWTTFGTYRRCKQIDRMVTVEGRDRRQAVVDSSALLREIAMRKTIGLLAMSLLVFGIGCSGII